MSTELANRAVRRAALRAGDSRGSRRNIVVRLTRTLRLIVRPSRRRIALLLATLVAPFVPSIARALPTGAEIAAGQATVASPAANAMRVDQSTQKAIINWGSFNIGAAESVRFVQPNASAVALNRVLGGSMSEIHGSLSANGRIVLVNPSGVLFARGAQVDVGGIIASSLGIGNEDFLAGRYAFTAGPNAGAVVNEGSIRTPGGATILIGTRVVNAGSISAEGGSIGLAAGSRVTLDRFGDGLVSLSVDGAAVDAAINNSGTLAADGGRVNLIARAQDAALETVINTSGIIRADTLSDRNGVIVLDGGSSGVVSVSGTAQASGADAGETGGTVKVLGEYVGLFDGARIDASGDAGGGTVLVGGNWQGKGPEQNAFRTYADAGARISADAVRAGDGGTVVVWGDDTTRYFGSISAQGGEIAGNGGMVEVSGKRQLGFDGAVNVGAPAGIGGTLLLDPDNIVLNTTTQVSPPNNAAGTPDVAFADAPANLTIEIADVVGFNELFLQATQNITVANAVTMGTGNSVIFEAGNDIALNASLTVSGGGTIRLTADADANGSGGISGNGTIGADTGLVTLNAASGGISVNTAVQSLTATTTGGGSISIADVNGIDLAGITSTGSLTVTAAGTISDTGALSVTGTTTLNAGANAITLDNANDFGGVVTATGSNITLVDVGGIDLGAMTATTLGVTAGGDITQSGVLAVTGASSFTLNNATADVLLGTQANDFGGVVTIAEVGTGDVVNVALRNINAGALYPVLPAGLNNLALEFNNAAVDLPATSLTGTLSVVAAGITDSGALSVTGTTTLNAGTNAITLDNANDFGGVVTATGSNITLNDTNALSAALTASAAGVLTAGGALNVSGSTAGNLTTTAAATTFGATTVGGNLSSTATGAISDTGALSVTGTTTLNAGANAITLDNANDFGGVVTATGSNITLNDTNALSAALTASAAGVLTAGGALNVSGSTAGNLTTTAAATTFGATTVGGNLSSTATGAISDTGALSVTGTTTLNAGANAITLDNANDFGGVVTATGSNITLNDTNALSAALTASAAGVLTAGGALNVSGSTAGNLTTTAAATTFGATTVGGNLSSTATGAISDTGALSVTGTTTLNAGTNAITLDNANDFGGVVTATGSNITLNDTNALSAALTASAAGVLTAGGALNVSGSTAGNLTTTAAATTFGATTVGGNLSSTATGAISDTGALSVTGTTTLNAGANAITLDNANDFGGVVTATGSNITLNDTNALSAALTASAAGVLTAGGALNVSGSTAGNLTTTAAATTFGATTVGGNLSSTATGAISDTGALSVTGTTTLNAGTNAITLDNANDFGGVVTATGSNITLNDTNALSAALTASAAGVLTAGGALNVSGSTAGNLTTTAAATTFGATTVGGNLSSTATGAISDTGALSVTGTTTLNAGTNAITLDNANDFGGVVTATGSNITLNDTNALSAALTASAAGVLTAGGALNVSGSTAGNLTTTAAATTFGATTVGGNLSSTATGAISDTGALSVTGTTTLNAGTNAITLDNANDFGGVVTATGSNITLNDTNALSAALTASAAGVLTAGGALNVSGSTAGNLTTTAAATTFGATTVGGNLSSTATGAISDTGALSVTGTTTLNAGANAITLDNANDFGGVVTATGSNITLNDTNALSAALTASAAGVLTAGGALNVSGSTAGNLTTTAAATTFGATTVGGNLSSTATGAISDTGALSVTGTTTLNAGANAITLDNANDFGGAVSVNGGAIAVNDVSVLQIATLGNAPNQPVTLSAGGGLSLPAAPISTGSADLTLISGGSLTVTHNLSGATVRLTANGGDIVQTDPTTVSVSGGTVELTASGSIGSCSSPANCLSTLNNAIAPLGSFRVLSQNVIANGGGEGVNLFEDSGVVGVRVVGTAGPLGTFRFEERIPGLIDVVIKGDPGVVIKSIDPTTGGITIVLVDNGPAVTRAFQAAANLQGQAISLVDEERRRAFSTDSLRDHVNEGGTVPLDALPVYPHEGGLAVSAPVCASEFLSSGGGCGAK